MLRLMRAAFLALTLMASTALAQSWKAPTDLDQYNVSWTSPSLDSAGSMPIGNGEVVLNVWVEEATGDLVFYIGRTDALSEISRVLKLGKVRIHWENSPLFGKVFDQTLHLRDGEIVVNVVGTEMRLFVDSSADVIHVVGHSNQKGVVTATLENWRTEERQLPKEEERSAWSVHDAPFPLIESADVIVPGTPSEVIWYHRNETSVVPQLWENQSLAGLAGCFDPLIHRTFGGKITGNSFRAVGNRIESKNSVNQFAIRITTHTSLATELRDWVNGLAKESATSLSEPEARSRTKKWWNEFWNRSWVLAKGDAKNEDVPQNKHSLRVGVDSNGQNVFPGVIHMVKMWNSPMEVPHDPDGATDVPGAFLNVTDIREPNKEAAKADINFAKGFTVEARINPNELKPGRIVDKLTAGTDDGFLFDTHPGNCLRLIVGSMMLTSPPCLSKDTTYHVVARYNPKTGEATLICDGKVVAQTAASDESAITRGYLLQRYVQACQGRGEFPIKFNGGYYTVEPKAMGKPFNADWRQWGDSHWFQNLRHMYHPMLQSGDWEMMEPFWRLYERARPLAESRTKLYHNAEGAYFPETMSVAGTYSGGDYGWDRTGLQPKNVQCPWWDDAWNQGPELIALMLDYYDQNPDPQFLRHRLLPMASSILKYFDTRFQKDEKGKIILDPTQVVETYWEGVVNDMPTVAGLRSITRRLRALPGHLVPRETADFYLKMMNACPELPLEDGALAPAQKYEKKISNVENGELYAVWPFREVSLSRPYRLEAAKKAYAQRKNKLDKGWGYDGNVAALLGMTEEAARILKVKAANSHPAYRWPATWGPNFDWLPDQNHGGNLLNTTQLMLMQAESFSNGGKIRILPSWPKEWDADFLLWAPGRTQIRCIARNGKIEKLLVTPKERMKDVVWPEGWAR